MRLLLDTNIILDYLLHRAPYYCDSRTVILLGCTGEVETYTPASTLTDINYF